jgi:plastocyanin domain-containing protein
VQKTVQELQQEQKIQQETTAELKDSVAQFLKVALSMAQMVSTAVNQSQNVQITQPSIFQQIVPLLGIIVIAYFGWAWLKSKKKGKDETYA